MRIGQERLLDWPQISTFLSGLACKIGACKIGACEIGASKIGACRIGPMAAT